MKPASLPLVPPWRMFFDRNRSIDSTSPLYKDLAEAFLARHSNEFPLGEGERWDASQDDGLVHFAKQNNVNLRAAFQIVGTFSNGTFLWGNSNSSLQADVTRGATVFRTLAKGRGYPIAAEDKFPSGPRDGVALLALCASTLKSQSWIAAGSGPTLILMTLNNIEHNFAKHESGEAQPDSRSWSPFSLLDDLINKQIARVQPDEHSLFEIETEFERAFQAYQAGDYCLALEAIAQTKARLGTNPTDKEPSGWMFLCEGAALLQLDRKAEAGTAFDLAGRCLLTPDPAVRLIGRSRAEENEDVQQDQLCAAYICDPDRFISLAAQPNKLGSALCCRKSWNKNLREALLKRRGRLL
jgi:hypothetical protein